MASTGLSSRAIIGSFYRRLEETMNRSWINQACFFANSDSQHEEYKFLDAVPKVREWGGQIAPTKLTSKGFFITNRKFTNELVIPSDDIRRDKTSQIQVRISEVADTFPEFIEETVTNYVIAGGAATYGNAYDGATFFSASHSEGSSGAQKNLLTSSEVSQLNVGTANAPTEAEMAAAILNSLMWFYKLVDDKGRPINGMARRFMCMVPPNLGGAALAGIYNAVFAAGASNSLYAMTQRGWAIDLIINQRLTTDTEFYLFRTDGNTKPLIVQQETGVRVDGLGLGTEYEIENKQQLYTGEWNGGFAYGQWQHAIKATLV